MEKLSSGLRINRAGDDAAGLSISEKMRGQIRGLEQAGRNAQDGISMIQTAEGALNETHDILQRMRELSVQASNDTNNADDRGAINDELTQLKTEINRISDATEFNGKKLLNGSLSTSQDVASSGIKAGRTFDTTTAVTKVDVSGADAGETFTFGYTAGTDTLTITGTNSGISQSIQVTSLAPTANGEVEWKFDKVGVSIKLQGAPTTSLDALGAAVAGANIVTSAGSGNAEFKIGSNNGVAHETISVNFRDMDTASLGTQNGGGTSLATALTTYSGAQNKTNAESLVGVIDEAIKDVSKQRSLLGASQNRLEHTINNLNTSSENLTAAESRVRDVDMAKEMMNQTKNSILSQAAQANQQPQGVLQLLR